MPTRLGPLELVEVQVYLPSSTAQKKSQIGKIERGYFKQHKRNATCSKVRSTGKTSSSTMTVD